MATMTEAELKDGLIYGDIITQEYVYMPASEIGIDKPICVYEQPNNRKDITLKEALTIIRRRSLKLVKHPHLGDSSC